jgi:hypothetical protein
MRKGILLAVLAIAATSGQAFADGTPRGELLDRQGDRIEHRLDRRGDVIDHRLDRASERAEAAGNDVAAARLDRKGDRIDRRLDRRGQRIDRRLDRRANRPHPSRR